ncbi:MAG: ribonuclease H family protein [Tannerella sp.]|nr:ribonuclease H family protein [Tannerella sp.]
MAKKKFYVVWNGLSTGIFDNWDECKLQVTGYESAQYKSFETLEQAVAAYEQGWEAYRLSTIQNPVDDYIRDSIAVDAACSGNPGDMEYRGVLLKTGKELFRVGPMAQGTNNIGEFLAIVHALALMKKKNMSLPVYSDSLNAISWIRQKTCKTRLEQTSENAPVFNLIGRAEKWLNENTYFNPVLKWETALWGEIPADFGRK